MKRFALYGAMIILMASCVEKNEKVNVPGETEAVPVKVSVAEKRTFTPCIEAAGTAYADREANLGAALPGRIENIYYPEGTNVRKGDLLVSLSGELYTQALVEFQTIEKDYERVARLNEKGSISSQDYDHVKARYEASKAKVEMMKKNTRIIAPFNGTIVEYLAQEGENYFFNINLEPGYSNTSGILRLMKLDPVQVEVDINEKELSKVRKGERAKVVFDGIEGEILEGKVSSIKPYLSTLTHSATARIEVANSNRRIMPGMFAHVSIETDPVEGVAVPLNAIFRQPGTADDYIFTVESGVARMIKVKKEFTDGNFAGVSGIDPGVQVVVSGKDKLVDGSRVAIK